MFAYNVVYGCYYYCWVSIYWFMMMMASFVTNFMGLMNEQMGQLYAKAISPVDYSCITPYQVRFQVEHFDDLASESCVAIPRLYQDPEPKWRTKNVPQHGWFYFIDGLASLNSHPRPPFFGRLKPLEMVEIFWRKPLNLNNVAVVDNV